MKNRRLGYIDALRGLLILLVVVYHLNSGGGERPIFIDFCWPFMMPGFFFISGFVAYREHEPNDFKSCISDIMNKLRTLVIPAVVFYMLYAMCRGDKPFAFVHDWGGYWFTPELFKVFCIYYICRSVFGSCSRQLDYALVVVSLLGVLASIFRSTSFVDSPAGFIVRYISNGRMFGFFTVGYLMRKYNDVARFIVCSDVVNALAILGCTASWILLVGMDIENSFSLIGLGLRWIVAPFTELFIVVSLFFRYRNFFESDGYLSRVCRFVGQRSLDIYMLHYFFLYFYRIGGVPFVRSILFDCNNIAMQFAGVVVVAIPIMAMSLLFSEIIHNSAFLAYWLLGGRKQGANR